MLFGLPPFAAGDEPRALTAARHVLVGRVTGESPERLVWRDRSGESRPLAGLQRVDFPPAAVLPPAEGPLRQIVFRGGDRLTGVLVDLNEQKATLVLRGAGRITLPRTAVSEIRAIPGLRDVIYEDFEGDSMVFRAAHASAPVHADGQVPKPVLRSPAGDETATRSVTVGPSTRLECVLPSPMHAGRIQLQFRLPHCPESAAETRCGVELDFATESESMPLRIVLGGGDRPSLEAPSSTGLIARSLPARDGWRRLTISFGDERLSVLIDEHVLGSGRATPGRLAALRLFCEPLGQSARSDRASRALEPASGGEVLLVDDVLVQESVSAPPRPRADLGSDTVELHAGDRLFGAIGRADAHVVEITGPFGTIERPWSEISRIALDVPRWQPSAPVRGCWAHVMLQPPLIQPGWVEETLELAIQSATAEHLLARHPILGELPFQTADIRRIEPQFVGTRLPLSFDAHHLGDEVRPGFRAPVPEGPRLAGEFALDALPSGQAFFAVHVAELEPSGPETPLGSPFLRELRAGHLVTGVLLNGRPLGNLNEQLRWRPTIDAPQRIRIPLAPGVLRVGRNSWSIEQRPARQDPREFDDAEFGPIALEFDER